MFLRKFWKDIQRKKNYVGGLVVHFRFYRRKSKRYSAFGGNSPFGKLEAYVKLEQLGEGSYATVFKGMPTRNLHSPLREIRGNISIK
jgi:hypothetical protein